jgi:hypothetical protein
MLLLVGLAESREKCRAVLGSPGLQRLEAARPARRRQARAGQGTCDGGGHAGRQGGGRAGGQGAAGGVLGPGKGQCSAVQLSAVQVLEARYQA